MSNGYFEQGRGDRLTVFDMFFRNFPMVADSPSVPTRSSSLTMSRTFISPRRIPISSGAKRSSTKKFLAYLEDYHFSGDIWAMREETPMSPRRTGGDRGGPGNRSVADRNHSAPDRELPVLGGRQGQPHRSRRAGNTLWDEVKRFENPHRYFPKPVGTDNMK